MLVFCEDCGEKNILDPARIKTENYKYRCSTCNFLNTYTIIKQADSALHSNPVPPLQETETEKQSKPAQTSSNTEYKNQKKRRQHNSNKEPYRKIFQEIVTGDDILGAYEYHFSDGLIAYDVDAGITDQTMMQIGKAFSVCSPYGHKILKKTKEIYLVLDYLTAICRSVNRNSIFVFLCEKYPVPAQTTKILDTTSKKLQTRK